MQKPNQKPITLGEKILYFRKRADQSQLELEINAGLSHGSLSRIEQNQTKPTDLTIHTIAATLDLSIGEVEFLFNNRAKKFPQNLRHSTVQAGKNHAISK